MPLSAINTAAEAGAQVETHFQKSSIVGWVESYPFI